MRLLRPAVPFVVCLAWVLGRAQAPAADTDARVREAVSGLYIHGMTQEIADHEAGKAGVPALVRMLADPDTERRDNVVAFLAYLGGAESSAALLHLLKSPPSLATPEDERAILLIPHALGRIAGRGDPGALAALLAMTAHRAEGGPVATAVSRTAISRALGDGVVEEAVAGLAYAGAPAARERLAAIAEGRTVPALARPVLQTRARSALRMMDELGNGRSRPASGSSPAVTLDGPSSAAAPAPAAVTPAYVPDPSTVSTQHGLTFLNHVSVTSPMTSARLDSVLQESTKRAATGDYDGDVPCCLVVARSGSGGSFGSGADGLATIDDSGELTAVLNTGGGRVKVVNAINFCGSAGTNIIGCAWTPGNGMAVVRVTSLGSEAVLWLHEYGHNNNLNHEPTDSRVVMYGSDNGLNNGLRPADCAAFHAPPGSTGAIRSSIGACTDDGDAIADPIDNCPSVANQDQLDSNGNSIGDVCENCADADGDLVCDATDNCPTVSNANQADSDSDRVGNACDNCPNVKNANQADFDADGYGDACETGALRADVDLSGRVDGFDLARVGLAFGKVAGDPAYDRACDLDRNGVVDGNDLALLSPQFGKKSF